MVARGWPCAEGCNAQRCTPQSGQLGRDRSTWSDSDISVHDSFSCHYTELHVERKLVFLYISGLGQRLKTWRPRLRHCGSERDLLFSANACLRRSWNQVIPLSSFTKGREMEGTAEMARLVMSLAHKPEEPTPPLSPHPTPKVRLGTCTFNSSMVAAEAGPLGLSWPATLAKQRGSRISERPCPEEGGPSGLISNVFFSQLSMGTQKRARQRAILCLFSMSTF